MGIAIIPKNEKAMKTFVGKTREWIDGFTAENQRVVGIIDEKIKDLKRRKPKLFAETSKYAMQMSIEELQELKSMIRFTKRSKTINGRKTK